MDIGTGDFSVSLWVKMGSNQPSYPTLLSKGATSNTTTGYWCYISGSRLRFSISDGSQRLGAYSNSLSIFDNTWHHIAVNLDRDGNAEFFVDGISAGTYDISTFNGKNISNASRLLTIGSAGTSSTTFFNGSIDDVRLYNKVLSAAEVATLANNTPNYTLVSHWAFDENSGTIAVDSSTYIANDGTLTNGPLRKTGIKGNALEFDGQNDRVECGEDTVMDMGTGDLTISSWVKMDASQLSYPTIVSKGGTSNSNAGYWFFVSDTKIKFIMGDGAERLSTYSPIINIYDNAWHHLAVSIDRDGDAVFYLDGVITGTYDVTSFNGKNISNPERQLTIGSALTSSTTFLNGKIDDVRIFNAALTQAEILAFASVPQNNSFLLGIDEEMQEETHLVVAFPNPFKDKITLKISSSENILANIFIYDINGALIKAFENETIIQGFTEVVWDGRNMAGIYVTPGMYIVKVQTNSEVNHLTIIKGN
ncbi:MAG TPA: LamG-like jellyroll fold domain-containing protein, partial [Bacteroidales bacterium]